LDVFAIFQSINTFEGIKIFRYYTEIHSLNGPGKPIGLIAMMNPGKARPENDEIFDKLQTREFDTVEPVLAKSDETLEIIQKLVLKFYEINNQKLPNEFTIHIENIFNLREPDSQKANRMANDLIREKLMFKTRDLTDDYEFVYLAWGKTGINIEKQNMLIEKYPNAIKVYKKNIKGKIIKTAYPVHPLYMKTKFFTEAAKGKLRLNGGSNTSV